MHRRPPGSVMVVDFELDGQPFTALNGGPEFTFNEAISLQVNCDTQEEIDHYWDKLSKGGDPKAQQCGWLKDRFGVSWQVVPARMAEMLQGRGIGRGEAGDGSDARHEEAGHCSHRARRGGRTRHDVGQGVCDGTPCIIGFRRTRPRGPGAFPDQPSSRRGTEVVVTGAPRKRLVA